MAASNLRFDLNALQNQAEKIQSVSDDLNDAKTRLSNNLETLRSDWVSSASDAFFSTYDTAWITQIEQYCQWLNELSETLSYAASQYEPLEDEYRRIELS